MAETTALFETSTSGARAKVFSSDPLASVDAPEPQLCKGTFVYNYFVKNERVEFTGGEGFITPGFAATNGVPSEDEARSRYIALSFKKPFAEYEATTLSEVSAYLSSNSLMTLVEQGYLHVEDSVTSTKFQRIQISGDGINLRMVTSLSGSSTYVTADEGTSAQSNSDLSRKVAASIAGYRGTIPSDLATSVAAAESDQEISGAIIKYINASGQPTQRISYYREQAQAAERADIITSRQETLGINLLVFNSVMKASAHNTSHLLNPEVAEYLEASATIQATARAESAVLGINPSGYDISVTPFYTSERSSSSYRSVLVGYIIEKYEVNSGEITSYPTIVVTGANITSIRDIQVNYGAMYKYRVRAVFMREIPAVFSESGRTGTVRFLVASSGESAETFVACVDEVPPPPPEDFRVSYDYEMSLVRLTWSLPVNSQKDIKYFQVFRRSDEDEAFQLLQVIDFDDSGIKEVQSESYPKKIITESEIVRAFYFDAVQKEKEYIYAVVSVDAHGLSSGYSVQLGAVFRRARNVLSVRMVSRAGAPKPYPNLYINEDTFADVVRVSGSKKLVTFLDAELLTLEHTSGFKENLVEDASFTISLINEDSCLAEKIVLTTSKYAAAGALYLSSSLLADPTTALEAEPDEVSYSGFFTSL